MEYTGIVMNFGIGAKKQYPQRCIIMIPGTTPNEAKGLIGSTVSWPLDKPILHGKITRPHGVRRGHLIATFKKGLPGNAIGTRIKINKK
jgi:ribosomal protein L35AE/L33A